MPVLSLREAQSDAFRRTQRQRHEGEGAVGATRIRQGRRSEYEQVFVVVSLPETVTDARSWIGSHAASAGRMIEIVPRRSVQRLAVSRLRQFLKELLEVIARETAARFCGGVQAMLDFGQRVAKAVLRGIIERQQAVAIGMHIVVAANARRSALRALAPI